MYEVKYQPHWVWAVLFVLAPFCLILVGYLGLTQGSSVPLDVAANAPRAAVMISLAGMGAAGLRRRRVPLALAAIGLLISGSGLLLLMWLG